MCGEPVYVKIVTAMRHLVNSFLDILSHFVPNIYMLYDPKPSHLKPAAAELTPEELARMHVVTPAEARAARLPQKSKQKRKKMTHAQWVANRQRSIEEERLRQCRQAWTVSKGRNGWARLNS